MVSWLFTAIQSGFQSFSMFQDRLSVVQDGSGQLSGRFRMAVWFQSDFSLAFQCGFSLAFQCGFSLGFQDVSVLHFMVGESGVELAKHARQTHSPGPTVDDDGGDDHATIPPRARGRARRQRSLDLKF